MKVSELSGHLLDFWVAKAGGGYRDISPRLANNYSITPYSSDWAAGGPIIAREGICTRRQWGCIWIAGTAFGVSDEIDSGPCIETDNEQHGQTPLEAAMRCFVASKFGAEVPDE